MYADTITKSMQKSIEETDRRRNKQKMYNATNNITPKTIEKNVNIYWRVFIKEIPIKLE